jgi:hypothetical protein
MGEMKHSEDVMMLVVIVASSIGACWFLPDEKLRLVFLLVIIGLFFDVFSCFCHVMTLVTRQYSSGFPMLGLVFYTWHILASRKALLFSQVTGVRILLFKLIDLLFLLSVHLLFQLPMFFQGPRENFTGTNATATMDDRPNPTE